MPKTQAQPSAYHVTTAALRLPVAVRSALALHHGVGVKVGASVWTGAGVRVGPVVGVTVGLSATMVTSARAFGITMSLLLMPGFVTEACSVTVDFPALRPLKGAITLMSLAVRVSRIFWGPLTITFTR